MAYSWNENITSSVIENYTEYTETDTGGFISVAANTITFTAMDRADNRVTKDYGAAFFSGSFVHYFDFTITAEDDSQYTVLWSLKNTDASDSWCNNNEECISIFVYTPPAEANTRLYVRQYAGDTSYVSDYTAAGGIVLSTHYYITVQYNSINDILTVFIYDDSGRTSLVDTLTITLAYGFSDYQFIQALATYGDGGGQTCTGTVSNLYCVPLGGINIGDPHIDEIRTNINTERVDRASLAAYDWGVDDLDGTEVLQTEIQELRTAIDEAYDLLLDCGAHFTSDDSTHDSTHYTTHYSSDESTHYTTNDSSDDGTHYATHDVGVLATHYTTNDVGDNGTHYTAIQAGRHSAYYHPVVSNG